MATDVGYIIYQKWAGMKREKNGKKRKMKRRKDIFWRIAGGLGELNRSMLTHPSDGLGAEIQTGGHTTCNRCASSLGQTLVLQGDASWQPLPNQAAAPGTNFSLPN